MTNLKKESKTHGNYGIQLKEIAEHKFWKVYLPTVLCQTAKNKPITRPFLQIAVGGLMHNQIFCSILHCRHSCRKGCLSPPERHKNL